MCAGVCVCVCGGGGVGACECACASVYALRIISMDKILHFNKYFNYYYYTQAKYNPPGIRISSLLILAAMPRKSAEPL